MDQNLNSKVQNPIKVGLKQQAPLMMRLGALANCGTEGLINDALDVVIPLRELAVSKPYVEYWSDNSANKNTLTKPSDDLQYIQSEHHLVLFFEPNESLIFDTTKTVYTRAYQLSQALGFDHLIRTWNYLDDIHGNENGMERYQAFCVARHEVLESLGQLIKPNPAATAIGARNGLNRFVFLFSKQQGQVVENKRQVSAWQYPQYYSPKQPRFSRAMRYGDLLMCSGTASVVGHETIHLESLIDQLAECLTNVQALLDEAKMTVPLEQGLFRFYLKNPAMQADVIAYLKHRGVDSFVLLEGDVCRENLLIECEAVFQ